MKVLSQLVLALAVVGSGASAIAQTSVSDSERRARNREEALANYHRMQRDEPRTTNSTLRDGSSRDGTRRTRSDMQPRNESAKERVKEGARSTRNFTHRQLNKVRNFGERQGAKLGSNPGTHETDKSPTALGK